jgi:hypothetical protein
LGIPDASLQFKFEHIRTVEIEIAIAIGGEFLPASQ